MNICNKQNINLNKLKHDIFYTLDTDVKKKKNIFNLSIFTYNIAIIYLSFL